MIKHSQALDSPFFDCYCIGFYRLVFEAGFIIELYLFLGVWLNLSSEFSSGILFASLLVY